MSKPHSNSNTVFSKGRIWSAYTLWAFCSVLSLIYTVLYFYGMAEGGSWFAISSSVAFGVMLEGFKHLAFSGSVDSGGHILLKSKSLLAGIVLVIISLLATQAFFETKNSETMQQAKLQDSTYQRLIQKRKDLMADANTTRAAVNVDLKSVNYRSRGLRRKKSELQPILDKIDLIDTRIEKLTPKHVGGMNQFVKSIVYWTDTTPKKAAFWAVLFWALILELGSLYGIWVYIVGKSSKHKTKQQAVSVENPYNIPGDNLINNVTGNVTESNKADVTEKLKLKQKNVTGSNSKPVTKPKLQLVSDQELTAKNSNANRNPVTAENDQNGNALSNAESPKTVTQIKAENGNAELAKNIALVQQVYVKPKDRKLYERTVKLIKKGTVRPTVKAVREGVNIGNPKAAAFLKQAWTDGILIRSGNGYRLK